MLGTEPGAVQQAGEEVGGAAAGRDLFLDHGAQDGRRVPTVDQEDRLAADERAQQAAQHPDGVADGGADEARSVAHGLVTRELAHFAADRAVRVHDPLGVGGGPRRVGDQGCGVGVDRNGALDRIRPQQLVEGDQPGLERGLAVVLGIADDDHVLQVAQPVANRRQLGQVVALAEAGHDDERPGPALPQDEAHFLRPVEVHDRHQGHAEHGAGVERDRGLHPVGQLEGDDVTRNQPEDAQAARHAERLVVDVADRAEVGIGRRPDAKAPARVLEQGVAQELPEGAVVPRAFGPVALGQRRRDRAELEAGPGHADSMKNSASLRCCAPLPPKRISFCLTRLKRKWASLAQVKPTPPCSWMSSPVTRTPASAA